MVPLRPITREALMKTLCTNHSEHGAAYNAGLGFYAYLRFHVDSTKFRRWNMDPAVAAECPPIVHPEDIATVGQPMQVAAPGSATVPPGTVSAPVTAAPSIPTPTPACHSDRCVPPACRRRRVAIPFPAALTQCSCVAVVQHHIVSE